MSNSHTRSQSPSQFPASIQNPSLVTEQSNQNIIYDLQIQTLRDLQRQYHWPVFPNAYPSPQIIFLHRQATYTSLTTTWNTILCTALETFKTRLHCPRCGQLPFLSPSQSLLDMNHSLSRKAKQMWRTLKREMENAEILEVRQGDLDVIFRALEEIERLYFEDNVPGCGDVAWNGGRGEAPIG